MEKKRDVAIIRVSSAGAEGALDEVISEVPVRLVLNDRPLVTLLCTPGELEALTVGFLLSEGLLLERADLGRITVHENEASVHVELKSLPPDWERLFEKRTISSGCGSGITYTALKSPVRTPIRSDKLSIGIGDIRDLLRSFREQSTLYLETGGAHSAALANGTSLLLFSEDIGRHNAVDKLLGKAFLGGLDLENTILLTSGRVTSEIMSKAGRGRIPIVISRAAPSCMAVSMAEDMGVTLVGFARGERMNVYSWPARIAFNGTG